MSITRVRGVPPLLLGLAGLVACGTRTPLSLVVDGPDAGSPPTEIDGGPTLVDAGADAGAPRCPTIPLIVQPVYEAVLGVGVFAVDVDRPAPPETFVSLCRTPLCDPSEALDRGAIVGTRTRLRADAPGTYWLSIQCGDVFSGIPVPIVVRERAELPTFDPNRDQVEDVAVGAIGGSAVQVLASYGNEVLPAFRIEGPAGFGSSVAIPGDLDADGQGEVVAADALGTVRVHVFRGGPTPVLFTHEGSGAPVELHAAGDVDLDGYGDVLIAHPGACELEVMLGGREVPRVVPLSGASGACSEELGLVVRPVGDLDGDGRADLARALEGGRIELWNGESAGPIGVCCGMGPDPEIRDIASGDFDGDGRRDLAFVTRDDQLVTVLDPLGAARRTSIGVPLDARAVRVIAGLGDVDGDGLDDIGIAGATGYAVSFAPPSLPQPIDIGELGGPPPGMSTIAGVGDLDGDGQTEIAWRAAEIEAIGLIGRDRRVRDVWPVVAFERTPELPSVIAQPPPL